MNIAMIGNIGNASFLLAEGLREIGHEVRLVITRKEKLHHPVLSGMIDSVPDWIYDASDLGSTAFENQDAAIGPALSFATHKADLAILNDVGPSLHNILALPTVCFLTGSDLTYYASTSSGLARRQSWSPGFASSVHGVMSIEAWEQIVFRQRAGIRNALLVIYPPHGAMPASDVLLEEIGLESSKRVFLPAIDIKRIHASPLPPGRVLRILNGARLNWVEPMPPGFADQDHKGTDKLLKGFSEFLRKGGEGQLTLVEKGLHINETRMLAQQLGIDRHIIWKSELTQSEFYMEMKASHLVCCNLGKSVPGLAGLGGMAAGRPVLANFLPYANHFENRWPVCDARTPGEIADHLWRLYREPAARQAIGDEARRFAENYLSPASLARVLERRLADCLRVAKLELEIAELRANSVRS